VCGGVAPGGDGKGWGGTARDKAGEMASGQIPFTSSVTTCGLSTGRGYFADRGSIEGMGLLC